ncbi:hypothetical protein AVEN_179026-1 [Araneus ventricosus]|uniref:Uncharacterized protein n=1 Tax=Araneus ventricosus TaxID=182803 RepID=A0A4Y2VDC8_ARAVE|nr:hypothetical protein AVEN_179026-1 [Araneus ventricosus]
MAKRISYYIKDSSESEMYCRKQNGDEYYLPTDDPERVYALNTKIQKLYAQESSGKELYAEINDEPIIIGNKEESPQYAKNESGSDYYPTKNGKNITAFDANDKVIYACDEKSQPFYPRDEHENEYAVNNTLIANNEGTKFIHPRDVNGKSQRNTDGDEIYPKDTNSHQYYPGDIAFSKDNLPLYAYTKDGKIIFETNSIGDETYFANPDDLTDVMTTSTGEHLQRYAQTVEGEEIYPKLTVNVSPFCQMEIILNDTHATDSNDKPKYPLDINGNEYTMNPIGTDPDKVFPLGYPITNDEKIIVPNVNNEPLLGIVPGVSLSDIEGLIRPNWPYNANDYVTSIKSTRPSRSPRQYPYEMKMIRSTNPDPQPSVPNPQPSVPDPQPSNPNPQPANRNSKKSGLGGLWKWILGLLVGLVMIAIVFMKSVMERNLTILRAKG